MSAKRVGRLKAHRASVCCIAEAEGALISGAEDGHLCTFDPRTQQMISRMQVSLDGEAVPSIAVHPQDGNTLFCCTGADILSLDRRKEGEAACVWRKTFSQEEVNSISISNNGRLMATADDAGQVAVVDVEARSVVRKLLKGHSNIASSVSFCAHSPWQVISGGLDCQMVRWDFSNDRVLQRWNLGTEETQQSAAQQCNPPMVHGLACCNLPGGSVAGYVATARGDGAVALYPTQDDPKPKRGRSSVRQSLNGPAFISTPHQAAATCISLPDTGGQGLILSGGNDGRVVLQKLQMGAKGGDAIPLAENENGQSPLHVLKHGRKVNAVLANSRVGLEIYVAGVSRDISMYRIEGD